MTVFTKKTDQVPLDEMQELLSQEEVRSEDTAVLISLDESPPEQTAVTTPSPPDPAAPKPLPEKDTAKLDANEIDKLLSHPDVSPAEDVDVDD